MKYQCLLETDVLYTLDCVSLHLNIIRLCQTYQDSSTTNQSFMELKLQLL